MVEAPHQGAEVAEQADASVSKTDVRKDVRVRLSVSAPWPSHPVGEVRPGREAGMGGSAVSPVYRMGGCVFGISGRSSNERAWRHLLIVATMLSTQKIAASPSKTYSGPRGIGGGTLPEAP